MEETLRQLEDGGLQDFPHKVISKSEIPDMMCAVRSFVNISKDYIE